VVADALGVPEANLNTIQRASSRFGKHYRAAPLPPQTRAMLWRADAYDAEDIATPNESRIAVTHASQRQPWTGCGAHGYGFVGDGLRRNLELGQSEIEDLHAVIAGKK